MTEITHYNLNEKYRVDIWLKRIKAAQVSSLELSTPFFAAILGFFVLREFITIMQFDSLEAVKQFAGEDYEKSYVPDKAKKVLSRHDDRSQHYEMKESIMY